MRKLLVFLCMLVVVFVISGTSSTFSEPCKGDLNDDGAVTMTDFGLFANDWARGDCEPSVQLPITGQTTTYRIGDDGYEEAGVPWPNPRFTDNSDGTVTDNLTGLIWLKQANYNSTGGGTGTATWNNAIDFCKLLEDGYCGLSDGSAAGDWRLPNVKELKSLIHYGYYNPALPNTAGTGQWTAGDPFTNVQNSYYWSSSTLAGTPSSAWSVGSYYGDMNDLTKSVTQYVWPVRDDN